jgi:hypothetical protein
MFAGAMLLATPKTSADDRIDAITIQIACTSPFVAPTQASLARIWDRDGDRLRALPAMEESSQVLALPALDLGMIGDRHVVLKLYRMPSAQASVGSRSPSFRRRRDGGPAPRRATPREGPGSHAVRLEARCGLLLRWTGRAAAW